MIINKIAKVFVYLNKTINIKTTKTIAMMITEDEITKIFCMADDFCKIYDKFIMIGNGSIIVHRKCQIRKSLPS